MRAHGIWLPVAATGAVGQYGCGVSLLGHFSLVRVYDGLVPKADSKSILPVAWSGKVTNSE